MSMLRDSMPDSNVDVKTRGAALQCGYVAAAENDDVDVMFTFPPVSGIQRYASTLRTAHPYFAAVHAYLPLYCILPFAFVLYVVNILFTLCYMPHGTVHTW